MTINEFSSAIEAAKDLLESSRNHLRFKRVETALMDSLAASIKLCQIWRVQTQKKEEAGRRQLILDELEAILSKVKN